MNTARKFAALLAVGMLLTLLAVTLSSPVSAAGTIPNDIPATALVIDGQPHEIAANAALWFRFDYSVDHSEGAIQGEPLTLTLVNATNSGVGFEVYTPDQVVQWWDNTPVGRGTPQLLNDNNVPVTLGGHPSQDLTWVGRFPNSGTYYVRVVNSNAYAGMFTLTILGNSLF